MAPRQRRLKGEGQIRLRPDGRYEARVTLPGTGQRTSLYGATPEAVQEQLHRLLVKMADGRGPVAVSSLTVGAFLEDWLEHTARVRVEHNVWLTYRGYVRNHVLPSLGHLKLNKLTFRQVQQFLTSRLEPCGPHQRPLSPRSIRQVRWILSSAFEDAVRQQSMTENLARLASHPRIERHHPTFLTPGQVGVLLAALPGHPMGAIYATAIGGGLRLGETLGICWEDLDLTSGDLVLTHQLKRIPGKFILAETKRDSARTVTLPAFTLALLAQQRITCPPVPGAWGRLVFRRPGGEPYHEEWTTRQLRKLAVSLELPPLTVHELRHTAASLLIHGGANLKEVSEFLGHSQIGVTSDFYLHLYTDQARRNARRLEAVLGSRKEEA